MSFLRTIMCLIVLFTAASSLQAQSQQDTVLSKLTDAELRSLKEKIDQEASRRDEGKPRPDALPGTKLQIENFDAITEYIQIVRAEKVKTPGYPEMMHFKFLVEAKRNLSWQDGQVVDGLRLYLQDADGAKLNPFPFGAEISITPDGNARFGNLVLNFLSMDRVNKGDKLWMHIWVNQEYLENASKAFIGNAR